MNDRFVRRCCILTCPVASTETTPRRSPIVINITSKPHYVCSACFSSCQEIKTRML